MSNGNYLTVNEVIENYGIIVAATAEETPFRNHYVVSWNGSQTFNIFTQIEGGLYEVEVVQTGPRFIYGDGRVDLHEVKEFANDLIKRMIQMETDADF